MNVSAATNPRLEVMTCTLEKSPGGSANDFHFDTVQMPINLFTRSLSRGIWMGKYRKPSGSSLIQTLFIAGEITVAFLRAEGAKCAIHLQLRYRDWSWMAHPQAQAKPF